MKVAIASTQRSLAGDVGEAVPDVGEDDQLDVAAGTTVASGTSSTTTSRMLRV